MAVDWSEEKSVPASGSPAPRRRWRWVWYLFLTVLAAAVICLLGFRHHWRAEFHRRIEAIRAAGFPVTSQELDASYPWPQGSDNAANWVLSAATVYRKPPDEYSKPLERLTSRGSDRPGPAEALSADVREALEQYIRTNAQALESLHNAAAMAECRYPIDLSRGAMTPMPHISQMRDAYRLLCLEAVLYAEHGDADGAAGALEAVVRVAGTLDREPVLLSHLLQRAGASLAAVALERVLNHVKFSDEQLARLEEVFRDASGDEGMLRALAGERCMNIIFLQRPQAVERWPGDGLPPSAFLEVYDALGLSAREGVIYLDRIEECIRAIHLPACQRRQAIETADAHYRRSLRRGGLLPATDHAANIMRRDVEELLRLDMARAMLAVERHRLAHAGLPDGLDQLVPACLAAVPEDPFRGAPLRYRRLDGGFVVYSVGEDGKDDGGQPEPPKELKKGGETWDIGFRVQR